jgi:signal transduction histidine kinase
MGEVYVKYTFWLRIKAGRLLVILLAVALYICLVVVDGMRVFPHDPTSNVAPWLPWATFGLSSFVALMFLAVGSLVWVYARNRTIAFLLFGFSCTMTMAFAAQAGASLGDPLLSAIGAIGADLSLFLLAILLFFFPSKFSSFSVRIKSADVNRESSQIEKKSIFSSFFLPAYIGLLIFLNILGILRAIIAYALPSQNLFGLPFIINVYAMIALLGILVTIIVSYFRASSRRERQQRRIFVGGVILAAAPLLLLTVVPVTLRFSPAYMVNPQLSTSTIALLPIALGYSILRYQFLVFDTYIRRAVAWLIGGIGLIVGCYLVITVSNLVLFPVASAYTVFVVILIAILAPCIWWLAKIISDRLFFSEMSHYQHLINRPDMFSDEKLDLDEVAQLLTLSMICAFETQEVCLFVLDAETGYFRLALPPKEDDPNDAARKQLAQRLLQKVKSSVNAPLDQGGWIKSDDAIIQHLAATRRPLFLREISLLEAEMPTGIGRYLMDGDILDGGEPLLVPMKVQGKMIGILLLGERSDRQLYAGPDFEAIYMMLARFAPVIETARLNAEADRHVALLDRLYSSNTLLLQSFKTIEDIAVLYTRIAADATAAGAELLFYSKQENLLHSVTSTGTGSKLVESNSLRPSEEDWSARFFEGESERPWQGPSSGVPACLPQTRCSPIAWLPLLNGDERIGMLVITYPRPHIFSREEKRVLSMFANQFSVVLENSDITIKLRAAYERQKELDKLKDEFITTASHELRTPLTAVQGYIELLNNYNLTLSPDTRADFIAKAHRSCDELTLLVCNITDANRVQWDIENVQMGDVPLAPTIKHVLEILETTLLREKRKVQVKLSSEISVVADTLRLRQILLNIFSNAIKYSPPGSAIEIEAVVDAEWVTVQIRDHGSGVPLEYHEKVFERFVRLERDINSPARGAGLGLFISEQLLRAMGGGIAIKSTGIPGEGTTIIFSLKRGGVQKEVEILGRERQEV